MKRFVLLAPALLVAAVFAADDKKSSHEVEVVKNITYTDISDAHPERHKLDLYIPKGVKDYPVLFFIHGGGWTGGKKDSFEKVGKMFAAQGIGFVATNYRLTPLVKHPGHIEDVAQAFRWTVANLGKRGADVKKVFVAGHSAGGHLAALLAVDPTYLKKHKLSPEANIKGVIPISGVFNVSHESLAKAFGDQGKQASPMTYLGDKLPPFLVLYADKEIAQLDKQAVAFGQAAKEKKLDVEVRMVKERDHGTIMRNAAKPDDEVAVAIVEFIRKHGK